MNATKLGRPRSAHDRKLTRDGYILIRTERGWEREHRVVMAHVLGRELRSGETVRWLNGDRTDNRAENLELATGCPNCGAVLGFSPTGSILAAARAPDGMKPPKPRRQRPGQRRLWKGAP